MQLNCHFTADLFRNSLHWNRGLSAFVFDKEWRAVSKIKPASVSHLDEFIKKHYLNKRPAICRLCLSMQVRDVPVGMAIFSDPPKETCMRYGGNTWELSRLYIIDDVPKNGETWFIGKCVRYIRTVFTEVKFLVSYADPSHGHEGVIYRASNWLKDGCTDQERKTPRFDYLGKNGIKYSRKAHVPVNLEISRIPRNSKIRYYMKLR